MIRISIHRFSLLPFLFSTSFVTAVGPARAQSAPDYEQPPVSYSASQPNDAITRLQQRFAAGELAFAGSDRDILRALLEELKVPIESQVLVFSKTSLQRGRIRPERPRALYFSDSVYVGWVPGGLIEVAAIDPQLGPVFYSFDPRAAEGEPRRFVRDSDCLRCHGGTFVRGIPAVFARSIVPGASGEPLLRHGSEIVMDETPFAKRWGGWYVTGYSGAEDHQGNAIGAEVDDQLAFTLSPKRPMELSEFFDTSDYLAATSDVVALLVFEHQMDMQNSLTRAALNCRKMIAYQHSLQTHFNEPLTDEPAYDSVKSVFASSVEDVIDHLLFRDAAPLPDGVVGHEAFLRTFAEGAPRSRAGHSLKDLQLRDQIFAQRCSYMIYSETFRALPPQVKSRILDRLGAVLRGEDPDGRYAYLDTGEKQRIYEILLETHPDAKAHWRELPVSQAVPSPVPTAIPTRRAVVRSRPE